MAGGATTPSSRFGGPGLEARLLKLVARIGRRMSGFAYRNLRRLERGKRPWTEEDDRAGAAGEPSRTAGAPAPHERHGHHDEGPHEPHPHAV